MRPGGYWRDPSFGDLEVHGLAMALKILEVLPKMLEKSVANLGDYLVLCTPWVSSVRLDKPLERNGRLRRLRKHNLFLFFPDVIVYQPLEPSSGMIGSAAFKCDCLSMGMVGSSNQQHFRMWNLGRADNCVSAGLLANSSTKTGRYIQ